MFFKVRTVLMEMRACVSERLALCVCPCISILNGGREWRGMGCKVEEEDRKMQLMVSSTEAGKTRLGL